MPTQGGGQVGLSQATRCLPAVPRRRCVGAPSRTRRTSCPVQSPHLGAAPCSPPCTGERGRMQSAAAAAPVSCGAVPCAVCRLARPGRVHGQARPAPARPTGQTAPSTPTQRPAAPTTPSLTPSALARAASDPVPTQCMRSRVPDAHTRIHAHTHTHTYTHVHTAPTTPP